jgi:hypothetical protein
LIKDWLVVLKIYATKPKSLRKFLGHFIALVEGVGYSHVSLFFHDHNIDRQIGYEATLNGLDFISEAAFLKKNKVVKTWEIELSDEKIKALYQFLWDQEGTGYSVLQLLGIFLKRIIRLIGIEVANPFANGSKLQVCLETVGLSLQHIEELTKLEWDEMGLREFDKAMQKFESKG